MTINVVLCYTLLKGNAGKASPLIGLSRIKLNVQVTRNSYFSPPKRIENIVKFLGNLSLIPTRFT